MNWVLLLPIQNKVPLSSRPDTRKTHYLVFLLKGSLIGYRLFTGKSSLSCSS